MSYIIYADEFHDVLGPNPQFGEIPGVPAHEGPVYVRDEDAVYFTSVPQTTNIPAFGDRNVFIGRLEVATGTVTTYRPTSNMANGMTLDREGRLVICEQGTLETPARIARHDFVSGETVGVVENWFGLPFNSPNDVVVKSDGTIWFTDPNYGALQGFRPPSINGAFVYRYDPASGLSSVVCDSFNKPNGLAFSPDESILYINDSAAIQGPATPYNPMLPHHIYAFDVLDGSHLGPQRMFAVVTPGIPDGLKCDSEGRVYSSSTTGVQVFDVRGRILGEILAPGVANFCFGGMENDTLFMMCDTAIRTAKIAARGAGVGS
ncbi:MAG TPA: SMP-30/gluconolactonase/LRE family protein [Thermoanaerobaculia bacterium]